MENELYFNPQQIIVTQPIVKFPPYENLKQQAIILAEKIKTVEVTGENIKESKKLLAAVNRSCKELEDERIKIKKVILEPYQVFEDQVKEIVGIVKEADAEVRKKVKQLEEIERFHKEIKLRSIFVKRIQHYKTLDGLILFEHFLQPKHLNKSVSIESIENEMIDFLESTKKDFEVIASMDRAGDILNDYLNHFSLADAIKEVNRQQERKRVIDSSNALKETKNESQGHLIHYLITVNIYNQKELTLLEMILQNNDFEYTKDKVIT